MAYSGIDLECGGGGETSHHHIRRSTSDDNQCFSDAEEGLRYSQFYSNYGNANYNDLEIGHVSRRVSDCSVDVHIFGEDDDGEGKFVIVTLGKKLERDCRICHMSLVDDDGDAIELVDIHVFKLSLPCVFSRPVLLSKRKILDSIPRLLNEKILTMAS